MFYSRNWSQWTQTLLARSHSRRYTSGWHSGWPPCRNNWCLCPPNWHHTCYSGSQGGWLSTPPETLWRHGMVLLTICEGNPSVTGLLWGESTGCRWIPLTKGQWYQTLMFHLQITENKIVTCELRCLEALLTSLSRSKYSKNHTEDLRFCFNFSCSTSIDFDHTLLVTMRLIFILLQVDVKILMCVSVKLYLTECLYHSFFLFWSRHHFK